MARIARLLLALFLLIPTPSAWTSDSPPTIAALLAFADKEKLWENPQWLALGHYTKNRWGKGWTSRIDAPLFFLSSNGKVDPKAELHATLRAFFSKPYVDSPEEQTAQCRYPARYQWLSSQVPGDLLPTNPAPSCPALDRFLAELSPSTISLIFPESYLKNPASLFGHTFLRIDPTGKSRRNVLLGYAVNFGARTKDPIGLTYAYKGLFGKYMGRYTLAPYGEMVKEYGDIEHRDIWEYPLRLSPQESEFLLLHLRELEGSFFDYYFLDENCSFQILALLEAVRPSLQLTKHFPLRTIPGDTLITLSRTDNLLGPPIYRPALRTRLSRQISRLDEREMNIVKKLVAQPDPPVPVDLAERDGQSAARILDVSADYLLLAKHNSETPGAMPSGYRTLLHARSLLNLEYQKPAPVQPSSPEQAMGSGHLGLGIGLSDEEFFRQVDLRPAYHDRFDPPNGRQQGAFITFLEASAEIRPATGDIDFNHLTLLEIVSFPPFDTLLRTPSWRLKLGFYNDRPCHQGLTGTLETSLGISRKFGNNGLVNIGANMEMLAREPGFEDGESYLGAELNAFYNLSPTTAAGLTLATSEPVLGGGVAHYGFLAHINIRLSRRISMTLVQQTTRSRLQTSNLVRLTTKLSF